VLASFAHDRQRAVPAFGRQIADVGVEGFGEAQSVQREQGDQRFVAWVAETGLDEQRAEFVAVQPEGSRFVMDFRAAHVEGGVLVEDVFELAVLVERRQRR